MIKGEGMDKRKDTGQEGAIGRHAEDLVCRFLAREGHTILERNWRSGHLEIDIITMDRNGIHFVEVKSRRTPGQADPAENVNAVKQRRIVAAAKGYIRRMADRDTEFFFDVATVTFDGRHTEIRYYPQAYLPVQI